MLNKVKSEDVPKGTPDKLQCNHQTEIYYKRMMAIALAALAFILTGEFQVAAVVLLALKCCQKIYAELCRRSKAQLPEEVSTSKKEEMKKVTEEIEMRLKAFQVEV